MKRFKIVFAAASIVVLVAASLNLSARKFGSTVYTPDAQGVCTIALPNYSVVSGTAPITGQFAQVPGPCTHTIAFFRP